MQLTNLEWCLIANILSIKSINADIERIYGSCVGVYFAFVNIASGMFSLDS